MGEWFEVVSGFGCGVAYVRGGLYRGVPLYKSNINNIEMIIIIG